MNERIYKLRKKLDITQDEFAKRIGLARNTIANYECGRRTPTNAVITSICKEFGVNEEWLRTGEGGDENMLTKLSLNDKFSLSLGKLSKTENEFVQNAIIFLAEQPDKVKMIEDMMKQLLGIK